MPGISISYAARIAAAFLIFSLAVRLVLYAQAIGDEIKIFLWLLAAAFLAAGLYQKEYTEVLNKAILICLECIGIG